MIISGLHIFIKIVCLVFVLRIYLMKIVEDLMKNFYSSNDIKLDLKMGMYVYNISRNNLILLYVLNLLLILTNL